jgi:hypothetical protein
VIRFWRVPAFYAGIGFVALIGFICAMAIQDEVEWDAFVRDNGCREIARRWRGGFFTTVGTVTVWNDLGTQITVVCRDGKMYSR